MNGSLYGVNVSVYHPKGGKSYLPNDLSNYLRKFPLQDTLKRIGHLSWQITRHQEQFHIHQGVPISNGILAYLAMKIIENSNDHKRTSKNLIDIIATAADMYYGLPEPFEDTNALGCLLRFGSTQLDFDREAKHLIPRTLLIYQDIWGGIPQCSSVCIDDILKKSVGLSLYEILTIGMIYPPDRGFFRIVENTSIPAEFFSFINEEKQRLFLKWAACTYSEFKDLILNNIPPNKLGVGEYDRFKLNPLHIKPILIPDKNPNSGYSKPYITPIPSLIFSKITRGLYFTLSDYCKEMNTRAFSSLFGIAFQEYVGLVLKETLGDTYVFTEFKYGSKRSPRDSPDWFVVWNKQAIVIEVKTSALFLQSKLWADENSIEDDIRNTIGHGVEQIWNFEENRLLGNINIPQWLEGVEVKEKIIVTYDIMYLSNSLLREKVHELYPSIPNGFHWHFVSIEEFEYCLGAGIAKLFHALEVKRLNSEFDVMSFRDYFSRVLSDSEYKNAYLDLIFDKHFEPVNRLASTQ